MCCRYWIERSPEMDPIIDEVNKSPLTARWLQWTGVKIEGEIRPADVVPVIAPSPKGGRKVYPMKWGFSGRSLLMNARVETAATKPTFRDAWKSNRCIIPATYYFEWEHLVDNSGKKHTGDKYMIQPAGDTMTWLCGLYRIENNFPVFVVLTREPGGQIRFIHDRMPLILPGELVGEWICPDTNPDDLLGNALTDMVFEKVVEG